MNVVLVISIAAPLVASVVARAVARADERRWFDIGCAVAVGGWLLLLVGGQHPHLGRLAADDLALAAGAGSALLALGVRADSNLPALAAAASVTMGAVAVGTETSPSTVGPLIGLVVAVLLLVTRRTVGLVESAILGGALLVAGYGIHTGDHRGAVCAITGAGAIATLGALRAREALVVLVPAALVLGIRVAPALDSPSSSRWFAVALAASAVAIAAARRPWWSAALVPWTFVAAVGPLTGTRGAAIALAAGVVLALALGGQMAVVAAAPGGALFTYALVDGDGWVRPLLAVLLVATVVAMSVAQRPVDGSTRWRWLDALPAAAGVWLVVRPTSWTFLHADALSEYVEGTAFALAAGLIGGVVAAASGRVALSPLAPWVLAPPEERRAAAAAAPRVEIVPVVIVTLMGIGAVALVRSARL